MGSFRQTQNDRSYRRNSIQFENQTQQNKTYTHNEQLYNVPTGNSTSDMKQENMQYQK